ncbi:MAG: valine--tRNA ligase [Parcubacteria group bacterium]|nr:valine--tRNA ligase [Parcubacteria group bacterium]
MDMEKPEKVGGAYDPKTTEEKIYGLWLKSGYFNPDKLPPKIYPKKAKRYTVILPPPNITGSLHMGHALNATIEDILVRYHRMRGYKAAWLPGTDHAGIAAQNVVEKELRKQNISRFDLGREKFVGEIWKWREKYGGVILDQLKKLGASCDWSRARFTMDEKYAREVQAAFVHYHRKGLIYRGERVVNWCPRCRTSLSDLEIEYREEKGKLWRLKYPLKDGGEIIVATTRPETMLGDAAVAVNPKDARYKNVIGKTAVLPIQNREIPVIADAAIDADFGTGAVKVTPAHDLLDAEIASRHSLPFHQIIDERGRMQNAGVCDGLKPPECREIVLKKLGDLNLIESAEDYVHNVSLCYRCGSRLEPILSKQWFSKMGGLAKTAIGAVKSGKTKIYPKNFEKPYLDWLGNVKDWCVSRQIWWGQRLPVWFCAQNQTEISNDHPPAGGPISKQNENSTAEKFAVSVKKPRQCPFCKNCDMEQSADVLDTWFSSALWPFAGLSPADVRKFYPSDVLVTARDIINLWVARMIFSGREFMDKEPFKKVLIHGTILTKEGKRMSKSLGTGIDPLSLIDSYGADAVRFGIIWQATGNQDIRWDEAAVIAGKKFANKLWNASRFVAANQTASPQKVEKKSDGFRPRGATAADKKILKELTRVKKTAEKNIGALEFGKALRDIYDFFWHSFCDRYIEESKKQMEDPAKRESAAATLSFVLNESLKMLHPFMPFITEEIYGTAAAAPPEAGPAGNERRMLMIEKW